MEEDTKLTRFENLLTFICIMTNSKYVLSLSPSYIFEKFNIYIGNPNMINSEKIQFSGLHEIYKKELIEPYMERWDRDVKMMIIIGDNQE